MTPRISEAKYVEGYKLYHCTGQKIVISSQFKRYRENSLRSEARE